ncbi:hypothetical protein DL770_009600 [Monosporascus sp. CRB-9-2]|nr:hypothetical protein DL770_009600 [Monosporascus sp. CRB-9-2]
MAAPVTLAAFWDVSIVACTVDPLLVFQSCLHTRPRNEPLELLTVTIGPQEARIRALIESAGLPREEQQKIRLLTAARGAIIATTDDHIAWPPTFLRHTLLCFEDAHVGGSGGAHRVPAQPGLRGGVLRDERFLDAYAHDYWLGRYKLEVGDDTHISRWLQRHGWIIAIQALPETEVTRTVRATSGFVTQMFRWERSTFQSFLRTLREVPQIWKSPLFVARKSIERVLRPILTTIHILAWIISLRTYPVFTVLLLLYYIWETAPSYAEFIGQYPYMWRQLWTLVLADYFYIVRDIWCWATLHNTSWEARLTDGETTAVVVSADAPPS